MRTRPPPAQVFRNGLRRLCRRSEGSAFKLGYEEFESASRPPLIIEERQKHSTCGCETVDALSPSSFRPSVQEYRGLSLALAELAAPKGVLRRLRTGQKAPGEKAALSFRTVRSLFCPTASWGSGWTNPPANAAHSCGERWHRLARVSLLSELGKKTGSRLTGRFPVRPWNCNSLLLRLRRAGLSAAIKALDALQGHANRLVISPALTSSYATTARCLRNHLGRPPACLGTLRLGDDWLGNLDLLETAP